ncbi:MAG: GNAT family N-acetyltransferase [Deltaproteobacteria bacterium]|jgi:[ribosomal protein S18]-alanine N-acetyltransferase
METKKLEGYPGIRFATASDLERVLEIENLSFDSRWSQLQFSTSLKNLFLVFEEEGQILGFLIACICEVAQRAIIMRLAVHPDHRGQAIATKLITAALDRFKQSGLKCVELDVEIVKEGAIKLYEKFGFKIMQVTTVNYEEDTSFLIMKLLLSNWPNH